MSDHVRFDHTEDGFSVSLSHTEDQPLGLDTASGCLPVRDPMHP